MTPNEVAQAAQYVKYLQQRFPDYEWSITTREELFSAIIYTESLDG